MTIFSPDAVKGVIFDYGATIDSNGKHWAEVIWEGYVAASVPVSKEDFRQAYVHGERTLATHPLIAPQHNFLDLLRIKTDIQFDYLLQHNLISERSSETVEKVAIYCYAYAARCISAAKPLLERLAKHYPMVLVSNFYGNIEAVLDDFGLLPLFPQIVESAVVGVRKPDPAIFALGVERLHMSPDQVVVIGDSYSKDIVPATSLGCQTIWIKGIGWDDKEEDIRHACTISDFQELSDLFFLK